MKLAIRIGNINIVEPQFKIYSHKEKSELILIGIIGFDDIMQSHFFKAFDNDGYTIRMKNSILGVEIDNNLYSFDLNKYSYYKKMLQEQKNNYFSIGFVFSDDNGKLKEGKINVIEMMCV